MILNTQFTAAVGLMEYLFKYYYQDYSFAVSTIYNLNSGFIHKIIVVSIYNRSKDLYHVDHRMQEDVTVAGQAMHLII